MNLKNKKILITGATGGIGNSLVKKFYDLGSIILATGTNEVKLDKLKKEFKDISIKKFKLDEHSNIEEFINSTHSDLGGIDVLINNADALRMGIENNKKIRLSNANGYCDRIASVSDDVRLGVAIAFNGFWQNNDQQTTINWTTSDCLADVAGQSTFQSNRVEINLL